MTGVLKTTLIGAAVAATALAVAAPANARDWHRHHGYYNHHHGNAGGVLAAGALGLAAGAVIGSVLAPPPAPVYVEPVPAYPTYYRPAPRVVYVSPEPWSRAWYDACSARYRSFDPGSGTYLGYDGARHFCEVN